MRNKQIKKYINTIIFTSICFILSLFMFFYSFTFVGYMFKLILVTLMGFLFGFMIDSFRSKRKLKGYLSFFLILLIVANWIFIVSYMNQGKGCVCVFDSRHYENKFTGNCVQFGSSCGKAPMYWAYKESEKCKGLPTSLDELLKIFED